MRATFFNTEKYDVDEAAPYLEEVTIRIAVDSPATAQQVRKLVAHAERACHAAQSLRHPTPVTLSATLQGEELKLE